MSTAEGTIYAITFGHFGDDADFHVWESEGRPVVTFTFKTKAHARMVLEAMLEGMEADDE